VQVICYDNTDRPDLGYRAPILRVYADSGEMLLQGQVLASVPRDFCLQLAAGLDADMQYLGPRVAVPRVAAVVSPPPAVSAVVVEAVPPTTAGTPAAGGKKRQAALLFD
jgi:hypothetical protein